MHLPPSPTAAAVAVAATSNKKFVDWEEQFVSHDRGSRVVHYYLKDRNASASLAVVGTERSLRHMVYVVCDEFLPLAGGLDKAAAAATTPSFKWRSKREVVDWLSTFLVKPRSDQHPSKSPKHGSSVHSDHDVTSNGEETDFLDGSSQDEGRNLTQVRAMKKHHAIPARDIVWVGSAWSCRKRLRHYHSFQRNGITISVHNFVYVMSEGNEHHIAYIEDMYEDRKTKKKLRVRWFHKTEELVGPVPPPVPHPREVFMTPFPQVLSVECVDGLATVLMPEHYDRCMSILPVDTLAQTHMCFRQFDNEGVKPFSISEVKGYWHQRALASIGAPLPRELSPNCDPASDSMDLDEDEDADLGSVIKRGRRTARCSRRRIGMANRMRGGCVGDEYFTSQCVNRLASGGTADAGPGSSFGDMPPPSILGEMPPPACNKDIPRKDDTFCDRLFPAFDVGDKVELLCQDSGIRGCWFRCTVLRRISRRLKVCYEELETEDGHGKLEEWVSSAKIANPDRLGIRIPGRHTMRPSPSEPLLPDNCEVGSAVDAWWNDGWWEGVILSKKATEIIVYFPDENDSAAFRLSELRVSRDWFNGQWVNVKSNVEIMKCIGSMAPFSVIAGLPERAGVCLQQNVPFCGNVVPNVKNLSLLPAGLENPFLCASASGEHKSPGKEKVKAETTDEREFECFKDNQSVSPIVKSSMCTEVKARMACDIKRKSAQAESKQDENVQLTKSEESPALNLVGEPEHVPVDDLRDDDQIELKWRSSRKRQRQVDAANALRVEKSVISLQEGEVRETSEDSPVEQGRWNMDGEEPPSHEDLKRNRRCQQTLNSEEVVKVKKSRSVHESLKPLHGPPMGNSLFINPMPLAGLVMSR